MIAKEKACPFTFLSLEEIELFLNRSPIDDTSDINARELIVNTLIREVILHRDRIVITYNFTDHTEYISFTKEHVQKTEEQISKAALVGYSSLGGACNSGHRHEKAPQPPSFEKRPFSFSFCSCNLFLKVL